MYIDSFVCIAYSCRRNVDKRNCMELTYKWIAIANRYTQMYLNRQLEPYGLNASQYVFLLHICRRPGITQDKLPDLIHINKSNVTRALAQLESADLVRRESKPDDKRTAHIYPTEKATALYPVIMEIVETWDAILTGRLTPEEKGQLRLLLQKAARTSCDFVSKDF